MAINFSGEFTAPRTPDEVFDFLSDPNKFAPLLPDFQSMSMQDATHFTVKVKVGVGNIRGSAEIKMELAEAVKPQRALYKGQGSAVGSQVTVNAGFDLQPNGAGTKVLWKGETSVFGKLASMAGGMLEPLGRKNIQKLVDGLQKALAEPVQPRDLTEGESLQATLEAPGFGSSGSGWISATQQSPAPAQTAPAEPAAMPPSPAMNAAEAENTAERETANRDLPQSGTASSEQAHGDNNR